MLENATRICEAKFGSDVPVSTATRSMRLRCINAPPAFAEYLQARSHRRPLPASPTLARYVPRPDRSSTSPTSGGTRRIEAIAPAQTLPARGRCSRVPMLKDDRAGRCDLHLPPRGARLHRQADRAGRRTSPLRPSSPSRTRACSTSCANRCEQQTATADVLKVILARLATWSRCSRAMLENATRICEASSARCIRYDGEAFVCVATTTRRQRSSNTCERGPFRPPDRWADRPRSRQRAVHVLDVPNCNLRRPRSVIRGAGVELGGIRTVLVVPMLKEDKLIGAIASTGRRCDRSPSKQIELVTTFADQAVIAIENTRLFNELRAIAPTADRHRRRAQGHQPLDLRSQVGAADAGRIGGPAVRRRQGQHYPADRWRVLPRRILRLPRRSHRMLEKRAYHARARQCLRTRPARRSYCSHPRCG